MSRLIDADAFKEYLKNAFEEVKHVYTDGGAFAWRITEDFCRDIDEQPTINAEPERKQSKWDDIGGVIRYGCPFCHYAQERKSNFCPNCGADMRGSDA